jgi:hypothetical protein
MEIKWTDLKPGDKLAFTPEFIKHAGENPDIREWFVGEVIKFGKPPPAFPIKEVTINTDSVTFEFYWEAERWEIRHDGSLANEVPTTPRVFDIVELAGEE